MPPGELQAGGFHGRSVPPGRDPRPPSTFLASLAPIPLTTPPPFHMLLALRLAKKIFGLPGSGPEKAIGFASCAVDGVLAWP